METGEWESRIMTNEEYLELQHEMDMSADQMDAEYQVITRIISQQMELQVLILIIVELTKIWQFLIYILDIYF